ncbi:MAG: hypothetical protein GXP55_22140 [Deltaproteobacteria bacterium]|nr:hypothetical protein [Deltaproteobacteria bacterium]
MSDLLLSIFEATLVFALGVPLATFLAKAILVLRWRRDPDVRRHGSLPSFLLIVAPSLATVLWFVSAALHDSEPGHAFSVCSFDHAGFPNCVDSLLLALLLSTVVAIVVTHRWRPTPRGTNESIDERYAQRLARLCAPGTRLSMLAGRVKPVGPSAHPICVRGFFRPSVEVSTSLMDRLADSSLEAGLLHEAVHLESHDPARFLLATVALALNPLGFLLLPDLRRWRACREAVCDQQAVSRSADPLCLAEAIVSASRLHPPPRPLVAGLGEASAGLLRLRVHLLMDYASKPRPLPRASSRWFDAGIALAVILSPHILGVWPLDGIHGVAEKLIATLGLA